MTYSKLLLGSYPLLFVHALALAQSPDVRTTSPAPDKPAAAPASHAGIDASLDTSYTASGDTTFRGANLGKSDAFSVNLNVRSHLNWSDDWTIPLGLQSQNSFLDAVSGAPVPDRLNTLRLSGGLGWHLNEEWSFSALLSPTLYKFEDIGANDVGVSALLNAVWNSSPSLTWVFGLMISPDSDLPVIPLAGLNWRIDDEFTLNLMFPRPRIVFRPDSRWSFHVGADLNMTTFRTGDTLGTALALPQYNDALGNYRDIRIGLGAGYRFCNSFSAELEGGYSVNRQIDYTRIDERVKFDPAPYVRLGLNARF